MADFPKQLTFLRNLYWNQLTGNVVIFEVDAHTSVVLSKAEKLVPHGQINWYNSIYNDIV